MSKPTASGPGNAGFAERVLQWFDQHGRKNLPWQRDATPYRVWVSEIMLQQTQVTTVIPYFEKFLKSFPDVQALASASQDQVLAHWSGLGYYARARNLHAAARTVVDNHNGEFPATVDELTQLPGIGRSTAGAIVSLASAGYAPILDGNVKRVLCRFHAIDGWPGKAGVQKTLWALSETLTPEHRTGEFNQAMMDLGATLCTRSSPACMRCPLETECRAKALGEPTRWPHKKPKVDKPVRDVWMLIARDSNRGVLLYRRPPDGLWGGLWGFPEYQSADELLSAAGGFAHFAQDDVRHWDVLRHSFTHFDLNIHPVHIDLNSAAASTIMDGEETVWFGGGPLPGGLAAPVAKLLNLATESML
jgi:A/G-specific adenine glycosylase